MERGRRRTAPFGRCKIIHAILPLCNASRCLPRHFTDWRILASPQRDHRNVVFGETSELSDYLCILPQQDCSNTTVPEMDLSILTFKRLLFCV